MLVALWSIALCAQETPGNLETNGNSIPKKAYHTVPVGPNAPIIDGILDDPAWEMVEWGGDFTQYEPVDGGPPTLNTSFKVLYDDRNLYVAFRCHDPAPDSIVRRMSRRDGFEGDWVEINIDSYNDKRSAFSFTSSVSGVKGDEFVSNNGNNWDSSWNPIWYLKTNIDEEGWTAEVRIPLSQLRFSSAEEQVWGLQFTRRDFRNESRSVWQYIPRNAGYWVSGFGELHGIRGIKPKKPVEIQPYVVGQAESFEQEEGNPFSDGSDLGLSAGLDGKIGVTNDLVLDFTINPDFGQVEADPSVLNLDGFQVFFSERRPFFIENRNIFDYQVTRSDAGGPFGSDNLFYSRRIGGSPHGYPDVPDEDYVDVPENTTILGAAKFSGKTQKGLSIGILESVTNRMYAKVDHLGEVSKVSVEPLTNYFVSRLQKDYDGGNTIIGGVFTAVNRDIDNPDLNFLHKNAYSGGLDFTQMWKDQSWQFNGRLIFSSVSGSTEAITNTQQSFEHYFQRPDADYLEVDTAATSLAGHGGTFTLAKYGGKFVFQGGVTWRSPGLELNDIGFMRNADEITHFLWAGYRVNKPFSIFRNFRVNYNHWSTFDFGGNHLYQAFNTNGHATFKNFWGMGTGVNLETLDISNNALFGGPALRKSAGLANWVYLFSDQRKKVGINLNSFNFVAFNKGVRGWGYSLWLRVQPSNSFNFSVGPDLNRFWRQIQSIGSTEYGSETRHLAGSVEQHSLSMTIRMNYNITPNLTVQFYGQPFISRGRYSDFKYITDPLNREIKDQFHAYTDQEIHYDAEDELFLIDENLDGMVDYDFGDPDFNFIQFRSNLVARWEYIPGSELFLVWTQGTTNFGDPMAQLLPSLSENIFSNKAHNIFLVKWTYRFLL